MKQHLKYEPQVSGIFVWDISLQNRPVRVATISYERIVTYHVNDLPKEIVEDIQLFAATKNRYSISSSGTEKALTPLGYNNKQKREIMLAIRRVIGGNFFIGIIQDEIIINTSLENCYKLIDRYCKEYLFSLSNSHIPEEWYLRIYGLHKK